VGAREAGRTKPRAVGFVYAWEAVEPGVGAVDSHAMSLKKNGGGGGRTDGLDGSRKKVKCRNWYSKTNIRLKTRKKGKAKYTDNVGGS